MTKSRIYEAGATHFELQISRAGGNNVQRNHIQASGMSANNVLA